jgi:cupin domain
MRKQLHDMTVRTSHATEHAPVKMWRESGPEWGNKVCAVHQFGPGVDATPSFQGLPDGLCPAPHWGYCLKGELTVRFKDGTEEVLRAGDAFHWPAGHTFFTDKDAQQDCVLIEFSELADVTRMEKELGHAKK